MTATVVLVFRIGLAVILYIFLWRVLQILWQDFKGQGSHLASQKKPGLHITTKLENGKEFKYHFRQSEIVIGRGSLCEISLDDKALSANHARVSFHHGQWWLEDLGSTNGTFLNKDRITVATVVITGDQFTCGNTTFSLRLDLADEKFASNIQQNENGDRS